MTRIAIVVGSTRPGRKAPTVAHWIHRAASQRADADFDIVDLAEIDLPRLDEPIPPMAGQYSSEHTRAWARTVAAYDGFVFVTPEYNHSVPAALKDALDYLFAEWNYKPAGFVSYGVHGGVRAVEHLRLICSELKMAGTRSQVVLSLADIRDGDVQATGGQVETLHTMLDELITWAGALQHLRVHGGGRPGTPGRAVASATGVQV